MRRAILSPVNVFMMLGVLLVVGVLLGQGFTAHGNPDPTVHTLTRAAAVVDTGVLVFREGLEAILTLAVISAGLSRDRSLSGRPIGLGAALAFVATLATWFLVVSLISRVEVSVPELEVQAATGLLAVVVLLVIMNWFFHRIYWEGWLALHSRKKREFAQASGDVAYRGLVLLGFTSVYREGLEVVLFLQSIRMQVGSSTLLMGAAVGLSLTLVAGLVTFAAHRRLPYQKMLLVTGGMLGVVFVVMVGEQVQEMQQAGWLPATQLMHLQWPAWLNLWFSVAPTVENLVGQAAAAALVIGSYAAARYRTRRAMVAPAEEVPV